MAEAEKSPILAGLVSNKPEDFSEAQDRLIDEYGWFRSPPDTWLADLLDAALDTDRDQEQREFLVGLLDRFPVSALSGALSLRLSFDSALVNEASMEGDYVLLEEAQRQLPGLQRCRDLRTVVADLISEALREEAEMACAFEGVPPEALDWLDDSDAVPEAYAVDGTCATCSWYEPVEIAEWGVLGECTNPSCENEGLFRENVRCNEWTARERDPGEKASASRRRG